MAAAYAMVPTDAGLVVALGSSGAAVFDATTFDLDESASSTYLEQVWQRVDTGNGVYALAMAGEPPTVAGASTAADDGSQSISMTAAPATPEPLIIGGLISRWRYRVAGNIVRTTVSADTTPPVTSSIRVIPRTSGVASAAAVPVRVSWVGADVHGSGVARYQVALSTNGGAYAMLGAETVVRRANVDLRSGRTYRFRVRAIDNAGNVGAWAYGPSFLARIVDQTRPAVRFSRGWRSFSSPALLGGSARKRGTSGASASFTFTGRAVGLVSTMAPLRGRARIYVDGRFVRTVDLRSTTDRYRTIVFSESWATSRTHTLRIVVSGTSGRPRVDVDGFVVLR
jgi:hypothetical protein